MIIKEHMQQRAECLLQHSGVSSGAESDHRQLDASSALHGHSIGPTHEQEASSPTAAALCRQPSGFFFDPWCVDAISQTCPEVPAHNNYLRLGMTCKQPRTKPQTSSAPYFIYYRLIARTTKANI